MRKLIILIFILSFLTSCKKECYNCNCKITYSKALLGMQNVFPDIEAKKIRYTSDKLEISGFIVKPIQLVENEKLPLIIYNRGGNRDFGSIKDSNIKYLKYLSSMGYVVMASQYRGNTHSEGEDEFGGDDVNDIKCLIEIAKKTDYIDTDNIGVLGYSRGGLMAYLLSKESDDIKTLVAVGAPTDMFLSSKNRPELYTNVFLELIGDSISNRKEYISRSPIYWAERLNEPMLILHGTNDQKVNIEHPRKIVDRLKSFPNKITHFFVEGGSHSISNYRQIRNDTIAGWFKYHLK